MTQYIDKSVVKAEIEKRKSQFMSQADSFHSLGMEEKRDHFAILASNMHSILSFLDTLEVKEVQKEPVSEDLEEAAGKIGQKYFPDENNIWARPNYEAKKAECAFKEGAQWQKEQDQPTIELAEDHAYLAGQEKIITKACEWLSKVSIEDMTYKYDDFDTSEGWYKFIEDFKKAMEE